MRFEVKIVGSGGQGIVLAGRVLARAVAVYDGMYSLQTELYGAQARGGFTSADVIISDEEIDYPRVLKPDVLLALSTTAYGRFSVVKPEGLLLVDKDLVSLPEKVETKVASLPLLEAARRAGSEMTLNMVALGSLSYITKCVSFEALRSAVKDLTRPKFIELNSKALEEGRSLGVKWTEEHASPRVTG